MSDPTQTQNAAGQEMVTALFLDLVAQHANMALIFLGQLPHPETGEKVKDLEAARLFIGRLEMLETKTRGNLDKREESLLKQSLMATRMAFVQAVETENKPGAPQPGAAGGPGATPETKTDPSTPSAATSPEQTGTAASDPSSAEPASGQPTAETETPGDDRKKFVKKY